MFPIPQTDPKANYLAHEAEIDAAIREVLQAGRYILGRQVEAFEGEFAAYLGARHALGAGSGTDALHLALRACGIGSGDAVIVPSHTAVATAAAIELAGAVPVFADIDPRTFTLDPDSAAHAIHTFRGARLRAIVPVHLYGHPADMHSIVELADRHGLYVVEDCAQAHGAAIRGKRVGTFGHAAAFSFYPTKNLGALGDGGALVTNDAALDGRARLLREYGWRERYVSECPGMNSRLDELQAAILRVKLRYLDAENACRRALAAAYDAALGATPLVLPAPAGEVSHVYHQYVIRTGRRDELKAFLAAGNAGTLIHYPVPVHRQPAYCERFPPSAPLEHTDLAAREILSLPIYPELGVERLQAVADRIRRWNRQESSPASRSD
jgi:dTDP-4-amino-4,6-dideoxygalactose transaminase